MTKLLIALAALTYSFMSMATVGSTNFIDSKRMRLVDIAVTDNGVERATWSGNLTIHGRLSLDIDRTAKIPDDSGQPEGALSFIPNAVSINALPSVSGNIYPDIAKIIILRNEKLRNMGLNDLMPQTLVKRILSEHFGHYEWNAAIMVKVLKTDIGCDSRIFMSPKFNLKLDTTTMSSSSQALNLGC